MMQHLLRGRGPDMVIDRGAAVQIAEHIEKAISESIVRSGIVDTGTLRDAPDHEIE